MISIIIPTYNSAKYLAACLESIENQSYKNYEIIIVDDGSADEEKVQLNLLSQQYKKAHFFYQQHKGVSSARNLGIKNAVGEYITFIDSDDTLVPDCLHTVMDVINKDPYDLVIYGIQNMVHGPDGVYKGKAWTLENTVFLSPSALADKYIFTGQMLLYSNCNKFYRKCLIDYHKIEFIDDVEFGEDRLFNWAYISHCNKIRTLARCLYEYHHRKHASLSKKFIPKLMPKLLTLHKEKVDCIFLLKHTATTEQWEAFAYNDIMNELSSALRHVANVYLHLTKKEIKEEINFLVNQIFPDYFFKYGKNEIGARKVLYLIIKSKNTFLIRLYVLLSLLRKKIKNER